MGRGVIAKNDGRIIYIKPKGEIMTQEEINKKELGYFIENIQNEETVALFAVRVNKDAIPTVTIISPDGWDKTVDGDIADEMHKIGDKVKKHLLRNRK